MLFALLLWVALSVGVGVPLGFLMYWLGQRRLRREMAERDKKYPNPFAARCYADVHDAEDAADQFWRGPDSQEPDWRGDVHAAQSSWEDDPPPVRTSGAGRSRGRKRGDSSVRPSLSTGVKHVDRKTGVTSIYFPDNSVIVIDVDGEMYFEE